MTATGSGRPRITLVIPSMTWSASSVVDREDHLVDEQRARLMRYLGFHVDGDDNTAAAAVRFEVTNTDARGLLAK